MRLAEADDSEVSLAAIVLPEHVGSLVFFDPTRFRDRAEIRAFVRSAEFSAYLAVASQTLIGGTAVPAQSGPVSEGLLERAREALHSILADLGTLAAIAAQGEGGPIAFSGPESGDPRTRVAQLAALARVAASLACEGAAPSQWQPIYDALSKATSADDPQAALSPAP